MCLDQYATFSGHEARVACSGSSEIFRSVKRPKSTIRASSASPASLRGSLPSLLPGATTVHTMTTTGRQPAALNPAALMAKKTEFQDLIKHALPSDYPGLSPEGVSQAVLGEDATAMEKGEYNSLKNKVRQGLGELFQRNSISRRRATGPNGGPAYEYILTEDGQASCSLQVVQTEMSNATPGSQVDPSTPTAAQQRMRDPNTDDGLAGTPQNRSHRTSESRDPLVEPTTTVPQRLRATDHCQSQEDAHEPHDSHRDVMALGTLVIQAQELNAESRKVMEELLDHKTRLEAAENEHKVSEVAKREYEVRMVRMDAEVQELRRQAAEA